MSLMMHNNTAICTNWQTPLILNKPMKTYTKTSTNLMKTRSQKKLVLRVPIPLTQNLIMNDPLFLVLRLIKY